MMLMMILVIVKVTLMLVITIIKRLMYITFDDVYVQVNKDDCAINAIAVIAIRIVDESDDINIYVDADDNDFDADPKDD